MDEKSLYGLLERMNKSAPGDHLPREANFHIIDLGSYGVWRNARLFLQKHRSTLTFVHKQQVASIHFDQSKQEIFYRGHNIQFMDLSEDQKLLLKSYGELLLDHLPGSDFAQEYFACLANVIKA